MAKETFGAFIDEGAADWQIFQRGPEGTGEIILRGRWKHADPGQVEARIVAQDTGSVVLGWTAAETRPDGTWSCHLTGIPAGGLYRLETHYRPKQLPEAEWSPRGDMRHYLGVGDLWVIAGQSNSAGYGLGPYHDPPELGVHLYRPSETWTLATHPMNESTAIQPGRFLEDLNPGHSPYLHFGRLLQQALGYPIGLVQTALGGSGLARWNPTENNPAELFEQMRRSIDKVGGRVTGILWYQGESDTDKNDDFAARYAERFSAAVTSWRDRLHLPSLPVLTVQLNRFHTATNAVLERRWALVRDAQRRVPHRVPQTTVVPSMDLPLSDVIHTSPAGNLILAERLARAALGLVYKRAVNYQAPDILSARRKVDGNGIELRFAPVVSRIDTNNGLANPFRVEDVQGEVPIRQVIYPKNDTVDLVLERPLNGAAVVHAGYGVNPPTMPMDVDRRLPILAFANVPVE